MPSLTELHQALETRDVEMTKQAAEEEAAGRIMARGFTDELNKLAAGSGYGSERPMPAPGEAPKTPQAKAPGGLQASAAPRPGTAGMVGTAPKLNTAPGAARATGAALPGLPKREAKAPQ